MRAILAFGVLAVTSAYGQYVISAHSGVIQDVEGRAYLNDNAVDPKFGQFPDIKAGQEFRTEEGRAEVLLTPGVFLRMGENSSIRMISTQLTDTRVEVRNGSVIVECDEVPKDNSIVLQYKGNTMLLVKHGLYRVDAEQSLFRVYDGEAIVKGESGQLTLKAGKQTSLDGALMAENFDKNATDELYNWSSRRANYLAKANMSSAMSMRSSGGGSYGGYYGGGYGSGYGSGWLWNPLFGMFTFVPFGDVIGYSPFGYGWYSPYNVIYYAPVYGGYGGGYAGGRPTSTNLGRFSTATARGFGSASSGGSLSRGGGVSSGGAIGGGGHMGGGVSGGGGATSGGGGGAMSGGGGHAGGGGGHGR
jgi:hypothetical protein